MTDSAGIYRIIELPPGTYSLTFSLPGFSNVKRDGLILSGSAVLTIPIDLRVGAIEETITVTGESPVVDVQTVRRETVLDQEVIQSVPGARTVGNLLNATPGMTVDNNGLNPTPTMTFFSARGGQTNEGRMTVNGMTVAAAFNGGGVSSYILDTVNSDEVSVTVSGGMGESDTGGPVMNLVPRAGGNQFRGTAFYNTRRRLVARRQRQRRADRGRHHRDPRHHQGLRRERVVRRPDQARPPVVLRQHPPAEHRDRGGGDRRQRERRQPRALGLGQR